jgi:hypothetical protein
MPPELKRRENGAEEPQEIDFPTAVIKLAVAGEALAFALERIAVKEGAMREDETTYPRN